MNPREKRQDTRWLWDDHCYRVSNRQCLCSSRGHPCCNHSNRHDLASGDRMSIGLEARQFSSYEWLHSSSTAPLPFSGSGAGQAEQQNQQPERKPNIFSAISVVSNVPEMLQCSSVNMSGLLSSGFNANMMSSSSQGLPQDFAYGGEGPANILGLVEAHRSLFEKSEGAAAAAAAGGGRVEFGLDLGQRTYFPSEDNYAMSRFYKRPKPLSAINIPRCQAEGCRADLSTAKNYHRRHKVCELHSKASTVISGGLTQRFCQQCSRFHVLSEFDEGKRSCRKRLADHNRRRRKPQVQAAASSADTAAAAAKSNTEQEQERNSANNQSSSQHRQMEQSDTPYLPGMSLSPRSVQPTSKALQAPNLSLSADPEADNGYNGLEIAIPWLRTAEFGGSERNPPVTAVAARVSDAAVCSSTSSNSQIFSSVQNLLSPQQTCSQWSEAPKLQQALNSRSQSSAAVNNPSLQGSFQSHEMLGIFPGTVEANYHQHDEDLKAKRILRGLQSVRSLYHNSL